MIKNKKKDYLYEDARISMDEAKRFLAETHVVDVDKRTQKKKNPKFTK